MVLHYHTRLPDNKVAYYTHPCTLPFVLNKQSAAEAEAERALYAASKPRLTFELFKASFLNGKEERRKKFDEILLKQDEDMKEVIESTTKTLKNKVTVAEIREHWIQAIKNFGQYKTMLEKAIEQ